MIRKMILAWLAMASMAIAQQPQTPDVVNQQRRQTINARWVNGMAPGYMATPPFTGLTFTVGPGTTFCTTTKTITANESIALTDNTVNYVFHDKASSCAIAK